MTNANEIQKSLIQSYKTYIHGAGRIVLWLMCLLHRHEGGISHTHVHAGHGFTSAGRQKNLDSVAGLSEIAYLKNKG